ncbi:MAG: hypothetical protein JXQ90_08950 [Cyclobacteriaceae bacterium]
MLLRALICVIPLLAMSMKMNDLELVLDLRGSWKFNIGDDPNWAKPEFDDSDWIDINAPAPWENEGFHGYDGYAWYRRQIRIDPMAKDDGNMYYLDLGYIDDVDEAFFNGELIGFNGDFPPEFRTAYRSHRLYPIPKALLRDDGNNQIAIRVYDVISSGGMNSGSPGVYRKPAGKIRKIMVLEGIWKFHYGVDPLYRQTNFDDEDWLQLMVPGFWGSIKSVEREEFGTYRKQFVLTEGLQQEKNLILFLGKIDDYDKVYLNGTLIGEMKDELPMSQTYSWRTYRAYSIDPDVLNRYGENLITVEVEDIGGKAGIYEGPVAIATRANYKSLLGE